jgi:hypothetical protein
MPASQPPPTRTATKARASVSIAGSAVAAAVLAVWWLLLAELPRSPLINPDSLGNLTSSWHRGIGYPLLIDVVEQLTGNLYALVIVQAALVMGALIFAFFQVGKLYGRPALGLLASIPFLLSTTLIQYYLYIWSEAVFIALYLLAIGGFFWALRSPRWQALALCGLAAGVSLSVKPIGLTLLLFPLLLLLQLRGHRGQVLLFCLPLWLAPIAAYMHYNAEHLGSPSPFLRGGMSLFAGTAHLHAPGATGDHAPIINRLATETETFRQRLAATTDYGERQEIKKEQHAQVGYGRGVFQGLREQLYRMAEADPERYCADIVHAPASDYYGTYHAPLCVDNLQKEIAVAAVTAAPVGYLGYVADNLYAYMRETYRHAELDQEHFDERREDAYAIADRFNLNAPQASFAADAKPPRIELTLPLNSAHKLLHTKIVFDLRVYEILGLAGGLIMILSSLTFAWCLLRGLMTGRLLALTVLGAGTVNATLLGSYLMMSLTHHVVIRYVDFLQPVAALGAVLGLIMLLRIGTAMALGRSSLTECCLRPDSRDARSEPAQSPPKPA